MSIKNVSGDADQQVEVFTLSGNESADVTDIMLSSGNLLRVKQDTGNDVNYWIDGESIS